MNQYLAHADFKIARTIAATTLRRLRDLSYDLRLSRDVLYYVGFDLVAHSKSVPHWPLDRVSVLRATEEMLHRLDNALPWLQHNPPGYDDFQFERAPWEHLPEDAQLCERVYLEPRIDTWLSVALGKVDLLWRYVRLQTDGVTRDMTLWLLGCMIIYTALKSDPEGESRAWTTQRLRLARYLPSRARSTTAEIDDLAPPTGPFFGHLGHRHATSQGGDEN